MSAETPEVPPASRPDVARSMEATPEHEAPERPGEALPRRPVRQPPGEIGGPAGPEPTRYGDWERNGRCFDF